jgi:hypothetical protein
MRFSWSARRATGTITGRGGDYPPEEDRIHWRVSMKGWPFTGLTADEPRKPVGTPLFTAHAVVDEEEASGIVPPFHCR